VTVESVPTIIISPVSGPAEFRFTVTGSGFTPGGMAEYSLFDASGRFWSGVSQITVGATGNWTESGGVPHLPDTYFYVTATDGASGRVSNMVVLTVNQSGVTSRVVPAPQERSPGARK